MALASLAYLPQVVQLMIPVLQPFTSTFKECLSIENFILELFVIFVQREM